MMEDKLRRSSRHSALDVSCSDNCSSDDALSKALSEEKPDHKEEVEQVAKNETQQVRFCRFVTLALILSSGAAISFSIYRLLYGIEEKELDTSVSY